MNENKTKAYLLSTGFSLLGLFCVFFLLGFLKQPLPFDLKYADSKSFFEKTKPEKNIHALRPLYATVQKKITFKDSTLFICKDSVVIQKQPCCAKDTSIKSLLLIGDSQVEFLRTSVYNFCINNNYKLVASVAWYGSTTAVWAPNDTINKYIEQYHPDFVICAIGLNEVLTPNVEPRRKYIDSIAQNLTNKHIPYYWIGPAAWTKDYGICTVMQEELDTLFYPSQNLVLDRAPDKRHPSMEASKIWFDSVAVAMNIYTPLSFTNKVAEYKKVENSPFVALGRSVKK
jgi:hypothetical protein